MAIFERMHQGRMNGFLCQGFNPLAALPNQKKLSVAMAKLKYLVVMDPLATETSEFWKNFGPLNDVDPAKIATEVFRLPTTCFAEETGTFTNSGRVALWKDKAVDGPGESKTDADIFAELFIKLRDMYRKDGGAFPDPILNLTWPYQNAKAPHPDEVLREINGRALTDLMSPPDPKNPKAPPTLLVAAGQQLAGFGQLRDDGSTSCGNWIYSGCYTQAGNNTARRSLSDPS